jgi:hypothetical protein
MICSKARPLFATDGESYQVFKRNARYFIHYEEKSILHERARIAIKIRLMINLCENSRP